MMKVKSKYLSILILALLFLSIPVNVQNTEAQDLSQTGVRIFVEEGPKDLFVNETAKYRVRIGGSFGSDADNWTLKTSLNVDASIDRGTMESNESNVFTVKITVREKGDAEISFKGFCGKGEEVRYSKETYNFEAIKPVTTKVKIENPTDYELSNIEVGLFIDGNLKNITTIDKLAANKKKTLTLKWSKEGYSSGKHNFEVWVDYNLDGDGEFSKEDKIGDGNFYIEGDSNIGWIVAVVVIASVSGFLLYYFYSKGKRRRRKPWKK